MRRSAPFLVLAALAAAVLVSGAAALAGDLDLPAQEKTLANGLKVIVVEDHTIPNCALNVWWRVGSRNERTGATGLAHYFEHMMFLGGGKYGDAFDTTMEAAGGDNNAFTTFDNTTYQDWFPKDALPLILDIEKDRMSGMVLTKEKVEHERDVVHGEFRKDMEDPTARMQVLLRATAYTTHPYHWEVLGWEPDISNWKQSDIEGFYAENYAPNNATVVLVGDVKSDEAFAAVEKALGAIPRRPDRRPIHSVEPAQLGERRAILEDRSATLPQVMMAWHICATSDADFPVFEVLEDLLIDGDASRLQRQLVEDEQLCFGVGGGWQGYQVDPSLFTVELVMRNGGDSKTGEAKVYAALEKVAKEGPTERELRRVKNKNRAELVHRLEQIASKAELVGETELFFGGWKNVPARLAKIEAVTADDVKRVAAKYFTAANRTVCTLVNPAHPPAQGGDEKDEGDEEKDEKEQKDEKPAMKGGK